MVGRRIRDSDEWRETRFRQRPGFFPTCHARSIPALWSLPGDLHETAIPIGSIHLDNNAASFAAHRSTPQHTAGRDAHGFRPSPATVRLVFFGSLHDLTGCPHGGTGEHHGHHGLGSVATHETDVGHSSGRPGWSHRRGDRRRGGYRRGRCDELLARGHHCVTEDHGVRRQEDPGGQHLCGDHRQERSRRTL